MIHSFKSLPLEVLKRFFLRIFLTDSSFGNAFFANRINGTWDTPKCYIHLWKENVIDMDWRQPLEAFGGKTAFEVAEEGFRRHVSQQVTDYHVEDWGPWDNSLFGLFRSTVGPDEAKNDFFENLN